MWVTESKSFMQEQHRSADISLSGPSSYLILTEILYNEALDLSASNLHKCVIELGKNVSSSTTFDSTEGKEEELVDHTSLNIRQHVSSHWVCCQSVCWNVGALLIRVVIGGKETTSWEYSWFSFQVENRDLISKLAPFLCPLFGGRFGQSLCAFKLSVPFT